MRGRVATVALIALGGCAAVPWDFPTPTMFKDQRAYAMTGFIKGGDDEAVRARLTKWTRCRAGLDILDLRTTRSDTNVAKVMKYDAILRCKDGQAPSGR